MLSGLEVMSDVMRRAIEALGEDMGIWVDAKAEALAYLQALDYLQAQGKMLRLFGFDG